VDIVMGTFSKSLASMGGFIAASEDVIGYLKHTARPFVFSASLAPASVAAAQTALDILREEPERRAHLLAIADAMRLSLREAGFQVPGGGTPIVPVVVQSELDVCRLSKALLAEGIYVNPVLKPAASMNLLRISCTAAHTEANVERLVTTLRRLADSLGIARA
jgi:7-keto-8-aminopelargonate synthetase-like enzyme